MMLFPQRSRARVGFQSSRIPTHFKNVAIELLEVRALMSATASAAVMGTAAENDVLIRPDVTYLNDIPPAAVGSRTLALAAATTPGFQIDVVFPDDTLTASQKAVFTTAAARWQSILLGDLPNVTADFDGNGTTETIDDVRITASGPAIDGVGSILGQAGPAYVRQSNGLPITGIMDFDSADLANLEAAGQLDEVILHEMGHVLGLGTLWSDKGLITGAGGADPRYSGAFGDAQYRAIFGLSGNDTAPVENSGAAGTRDGHWRETTFSNELMTGYLGGGDNPLSRLTIAQYADLGYPSVNLNGFDVYSRPDGGGNAYPTIASVADSADPVPVGSMLRLTAVGVSDADGSVSSVKFYRESNGIPGLQVLAGSTGDVAGDLLLATDNTPADGFAAGVPTTGLTVGKTYTYYAQATDNQNLAGVAVSTTNAVGSGVTITPAPPVLSSITVNDGAAQRSQVTSITLNFDRPVTLSTGALSLSQLNAGGSGSNDGTAPSGASAVLGSPTPLNGGQGWRYAFVGGSPFAQTSGAGAFTGSLVDGTYTAAVDPTKVSADGVVAVAGGTLTFHRLFGDLDGNHTVNNGDFGRFRLTFGHGTADAAYNPGFDFDNNGSVNNADFGQFRVRFGKALIFG